MDFIDAVRKKIEASVEGTDWSVWTSNPSVNGVRCWLYSASIIHGPRICGQMNAGLYRDMQGGAGAFSAPGASGYSVIEMLGAAVEAFDAEVDVAKQKAITEPFMHWLAAYARSTQTWASVPALSEVDGIHFVAVDWVTAKERRIFRPMAFLGSGIPSNEAMAKGMTAQLAMHLSRFPDDLPVELLR